MKKGYDTSEIVATENDDFRAYKHKALRDCVEKNGLKADISLKSYLPGRVVAEATITDPATGFTISEVGSVCKRGSSEIGKEFPVEVAYTAAYDHAAVSILGLHTKDKPVWSYSHALDNLALPAHEGNFIQDGALILPHRQIKIALLSDYRYEWKYKLLVCDAKTVIVECTITDRLQNRTFTDVGSAIEDCNLRTGEEMMFPVELAYNRAFDRAAIAALYNTATLPEGVRGIYSNMEIIARAQQEEAETPPMPVAPEVSEVFANAEKAGPVQPVNTATGTDEEVILFGICKGKTFAEVRGTEEEAKTIAWIKKSGIQYPDEARRAQVERFLKLSA